MQNDTENQTKNVDIAVIGAGLVGLTAALAASRSLPDATVAVIGPGFDSDPARPDTRTTAIFNPGLHLLENLGVQQHLQVPPAPLRGIRIIDDMGGLFRAPEALFRADEVGESQFGANITNADLNQALRTACDGQANLHLHKTAGVTAIETAAPDIQDNDSHGTADSDAPTNPVTITTAEQATIKARLVLGADGRTSITREAANIKTRNWDYDQTAIVCAFDHESAHDDISTEFHRPSGPFTLVPVTANRSSLVWVERPREAERLKALSDEAFLDEVSERSRHLLGALDNIGPRGMFPLKGMTARKFGTGPFAVLGEAAHVMPPIGAQGLNLGLRDVGALCDCLEDAANRSGRDLNVSAITAAYDRHRRADVEIRTLGVDLLSKSLTITALPVQIGRTIGLHALNLLTPLRRTLIRQGMAPAMSLPRAMQRP